ncbi:LLM class flavin-dependent oxidoreductase [Amycolatopsis endophytica]|uniref:Alkanesulfonate monooxygenase SsuD/methylene tetrahydromethanopterin reductase-like flavin-dependent oxidoreductase (Luciferase family) n=2 Tax=Amycolatopsis endophytica TaxID=860233 RepID=A0A853BD92_9PSEU|nr:alkanesulfonate monooxygenase SsuD/methylene tetrahydromethanopterin reductase-like flavin-dependent oxidoreductase (luciferase family) [Amycolatopsis endophytica]
MHYGIGLPIGRPENLTDWARRADDGPFRTLGLLDRIVYDNPEPLVTLAVLAGATTRVRLQTEVLLAPLREPALLAKQAATLDRLSGGRFTLGLGVGGREDDHHATGTDPRHRGRVLDEQMARMRRIWSSAEGIGPAPATPGGPEVLFGAFADPALRRVARHGDGFLCAAPPQWVGELFAKVERFWAEEGHDGRPRMVAQVNVALGSSVDEARSAILDYYGFTGDWARNTAERMLTTPEQVREAAKQFADLGADELIFYCWGTDPDQADRLADVVS